MRLVFLDLETTSLDPEQGEIIEVAAVRVDWPGNKEHQRLVSLVKPLKGPLPSIVTSITGITDEMLTEAPAWSTVKEQLEDLIQPSDILVAHNADFDIQFLAAHGLKLPNKIWDTFWLATVAWPEAESYNLGMLARSLEISAEGEHRALADVQLSRKLLKKIGENLAVTPPIFEKIATLLHNFSLDHYQPIFSVLKPIPINSRQELDGQPEDRPTAFIPSSQSLEDAIALIMGPGGVLARQPGLQHRPGQLSMASFVTDLLLKKHCGIVEAPPGTGKTFGYLIPAILWKHSSQEKSPLIISTHTKNLQDQLLEHDVPAVLSLLRMAYKVATLKGRRNYVCVNRLHEFMASSYFHKEHVWGVLKILVWLDRGGDGQLERLRFVHQNWEVLRFVHSDSPACRLRCGTSPECFYTKAKKKAQEADIVIINHALLSNFSLDPEPQLLPLTYVVVDEAHHLAETARAASQRDLSAGRLKELCVGLEKPLADIEKPLFKRFHDDLIKTHQLYEGIEQSFLIFLDRHSPHGQLLITPTTRHSHDWKKIQNESGRFIAKAHLLLGLARSFIQSISEHHQSLMLAAIKDLEQFLLWLSRYIEGGEDRIQWLEKRGDRFVYVADVAMSVPQLLEPLFGAAASLVLTSATLSISGNFDYMKGQLGATNVRELRVDQSPFAYRTQMMVCILENMPPPFHQHYDTQLSETIFLLTKTLSGRMLVLLTSHKAVKNLYHLLNKSLNEEGISLLAQRITGGRPSLLNKFRSQQPAVLLATSSFWEGIDIPGDSLSCVFIPKLPFAPPDDPILQALAEHDRVDAFTHLSVPQMVLRLRQGIGRLIRATTDKGVVVLGDARFLRFDYGQQVQQSLPPATIKITRREEVGEEVQKWFGEEVLQNWKKEIGK